ncbi:unnamed protein product [Bemisia tabaci]|uniref:Uncharacterized protein n=1 Tax=Bemisia tabaci TaxID=7038 RepID=A0A9P0AE60_BEMTA|nr:unnamed protein product [Bemisia tabaci]
MLIRHSFCLVAFFLLCVGLTECLGGPGKNTSNGRSNVRTYKAENAKEMEFHQNLNGGWGLSDSVPPKSQKGRDVPPKKSKGSGISAWALIGLILGAILSGVFVYYAMIFYPILCKKERKYDVMEVSATP